MPLPTPQRSDYIVQGSWNSGMITTLPAEELPEDAAVLIENFEFDDIANITTRLSPTTLIDTALDGIVGMYTARFSDGTSKILFAVDNNDVNPNPELYWMNVDGSSITKLSDNLINTTATRVHFTMFNDVVIVTFLSSGNANGASISSVDSSGTITNISALTDAPLAVYAIEWNNRLWTFGNTPDISTLYASAINDETDWVVDDDAGAINLTIGSLDGDFITALAVFRGNLIVYKLNKIYVVSAISAPATIPSNLRVDLYSDKVGCIQAETVQNLLDDQVFLSNLGVTSLALTGLGNVKGAVLSRNIDELSKVKIVGSSLTNHSIGSSCDSINIKHKQQYWIYVPDDAGNGTDTVWVMDYSDINKQDSFGFPLIRWCKFTGNIVSNIYTELSSSNNTYILLSLSDSSIVLLYDPITNSTTFTGTHTRRLLTKAFGSAQLRSIWHRFAATLTKLTTNVAYTISYYYDNYITSSAGSYSEALTGTPANNNRTIWRSFKKNDSGRKANLVQIDITANTTNQGFTIKSVALERTQLNFRRSTTKWNSD